MCGSGSMWGFVGGCLNWTWAFPVKIEQWGYFKFRCQIIKNEGEWYGKTKTSSGCHIYIHKFLCDLTKGADACYTQENPGKHTRETNCRERERKKETKGGINKETEKRGRKKHIKKYKWLKKNHFKKYQNH